MQSSVPLGKVYDMLIEKKLGSPNSFVGRLQCQNNITVYDKLSLVGMQLLEKFKNFDVFSERKSLRRAFARNVEIPLIFFRYLHPYQRKLVNIGTILTLA
jgi:hypothetical protein